jgi:hypothetical protein
MSVFCVFEVVQVYNYEGRAVTFPPIIAPFYDLIHPNSLHIFKHHVSSEVQQL